MVWSLFSAANIYFYSSIDTGYFADDSTVLPFLNLWSLGVEEQFYILWPFLVLFLLKYVVSKKKRIFIASALFIGSFVWAQAIIINNQSFAYYMLPTRSWELLSGSIIALLMHSGFRIKNVVNELMALIGFLAIVLSLIFVSESSPVPGIGALPAVLGSSFIILSGITHKTYIGRFLSFRLLVAIGLISYSAYLWHWPILAFLRYAFIDIKGIVAVTVFLLTLGIATLSYFFIETPLRINNASTNKVYLGYFVVPVAVLVALSLYTEYAIKKNSESIFPWEKLHTSKRDMQPAFAYKYNCQYSLFDKKAYTEQRCGFPENIEKANTFLMGDSNAAHYLGMLRVFAEFYGFSIHNATQSSCPPIFEGEFVWINSKYQKGCSIYRSSVFDEAKKYDTVFVGGAWNIYFQKKGFKEGFEKTVERLSRNVNHVVLLAKIPIFSSYNKDCEIRAIRIASLDCTMRFNNTLPADVSNQFLREIAKKYNNVDYFDIREQLCKNGVCSPYLDGRPAYYDSGHLSMKGSERIGKNMIASQSAMLANLKYLTNKKQIYRTHVFVDNNLN
jgi:hypothetical protein